MPMYWATMCSTANILTVIASESYDDFAKKLQTDMAEACANRRQW